MSSRRIVITGGTGLIGSALCRALLDRGDHLHLLARNPEKAKAQWPEADRVSLWAPGVSGEWQSSFAEADAVVHLAGESVGAQRWTAAYKQRIHDSRIRGTRELVDAIRRADPRPSVLVAASAVGYYGDTGDRLTPESAPAGQGFLAKLCESWERLALKAQDYGIRVAVPRIGIVLDREGGALPRMAQPFRWYLGGPIGSGRQYLPWIHLDDLVALLLLALDDDRLSGPFNAIAPEAVTQKHFAHVLGTVLDRPSWLPVPGLALRLAIGEFATSLLQGQHLEPDRARELGFRWRHPELGEALRAVYGTAVSG